MPLQKNQILTLRIERLSSDGSGVAHSPDGETVFVPGAAPGDDFFCFNDHLCLLRIIYCICYNQVFTEQ